MDGEFRKVLEQALRDLAQRYGDIEACLSRFPDYADELRPYLEVAATLAQTTVIDPSTAAQVRGRQRVLATIAEAGKIGGRRTMFRRIPAPLATAVAALAILTAGATGASALSGGFLGGVSLSGSGDGKDNVSAALDSAASASVDADASGVEAHDFDKPDTDGDGFSDRFEQLAGSDATNAASTPELRWLKDTCSDGADDDGDGATDADDEGCEDFGFFNFDHDFDKPDTDGDGFSDRFEQFAGSDPSNATSTPELRWLKDTCSDGADTDGDGATDDADDGCEGFGFFDSGFDEDWHSGDEQKPDDPWTDWNSDSSDGGDQDWNWDGGDIGDGDALGGFDWGDGQTEESHDWSGGTGGSFDGDSGDRDWGW